LRRLIRPSIPLRAKTPRQKQTTGQDRVRLLKTGAQHTPETPNQRQIRPKTKAHTRRPPAPKGPPSSFNLPDIR